MSGIAFDFLTGFLSFFLGFAFGIVIIKILL